MGFQAFIQISFLCLSRYRRSYDSDFTAPLVAYHVWPALLENDTIIVKGEAVTKRGALVGILRLVKRSHPIKIPRQFWLGFVIVKAHSVAHLCKA